GPGGGMDRCCCETFGKRGRCIAGSLIGGECDVGGSPVINDVQIPESAIRGSHPWPRVRVSSFEDVATTDARTIGTTQHPVTVEWSLSDWRGPRAGTVLNIPGELTTGPPPGTIGRRRGASST
ncbi:MAG: hypothetical protein OXC91_12675, partial [Rhodobacteraceae bacterium]|nr:hypothetical protein [Paracoccaceae bacterium]